jgi:hypothetical protein
MKKLIAATALVLGSWAGVAQAAPTITSPTTLNLVSFGTGTGTGLQTGATTAAVAAGYTFTGVAGVFSGTSPTSDGINGYTSPFTSGDLNRNYLAVEPNGSVSFSFGSAQTTFGALIGTLDSYNFLTFSGVGASQTFSGADIVALLGGSDSGVTTRNLLFSGLNPFTTVTASDNTFSAFEFVPAVTSSVPEPAAWGMMILGFGLVGGVLRRRSSAKVNVRFA